MNPTLAQFGSYVNGNKKLKVRNARYNETHLTDPGAKVLHLYPICPLLLAQVYSSN